MRNQEETGARIRRRLLPAVLALALLASTTAAAQEAPGSAGDLAGQAAVAAGEAGIDEKPGAQVALDAVLRDEEGNEVTLRRLIDKPTILTLNYFTCTSICSPLLNGLVDAINRIEIQPGRDFQVITLSFDPKDTPEVARQKRINYLKQMNRPFPPEAWRFLTGNAANTREVTDSVGFDFRPTSTGFVHPGAVVVLTPQGRVSRYLYGINFLPADVQMAVAEAREGQVRPSVARVLAFCYSYDPEGRRYVFNITRVAGTLILLLGGGFLIYLLVAGRSRRGRQKETPSA